MSNIKWIKLSTSMFEDEKIRLIEQMPDADTILIIWVKLLAQAGKTNASGYIYLSENIPYTDEMLAAIFSRPVNTVRLALKTFEDFGMITIDDDNYISISNWEKHQNIDALEKIRKQTRERVARHRERQKLKKQAEPLHVTEEKENKQRNNNEKEVCNVTVTKSNATEEERRKKNKKENKNNKYIRDLYDHYLSKNIIRHRKLTDAMKRVANARLKDYSFEELKKAIDNYAKVLHSDNHWFTHKYPFGDLMREKDITRFLDEADPLNNFLKRSNSRFANQPNQEVIPDWFEKRHEQTEQQDDEDESNIIEMQKILAKYKSN